MLAADLTLLRDASASAFPGINPGHLFFFFLLLFHSYRNKLSEKISGNVKTIIIHFKIAVLGHLISTSCWKMRLWQTDTFHNTELGGKQSGWGTRHVLKQPRAALAGAVPARLLQNGPAMAPCPLGSHRAGSLPKRRGGGTRCCRHLGVLGLQPERLSNRETCRRQRA